MNALLNTFIWISLTCSIPWMPKAMASASVFEQANELYKNAAYDSAATLYEHLLVTEKSNYVLHYNLGNTYYKLHKTGKAIVQYERALLLQPDDDEILHNLEVVRKQTVDKLRPVPQLGIVTAWQSLLNTLNSYGWGMLALALIWSGFICLALYLLFFSQKMLRTAGWCLMAASFIPLLLGIVKYRVESTSGFGILISENTYVKSAPDDQAANLFIIHEGIKFRTLDNVRPWVKIRLEDGKTGWIKEETAEFI